MKIKAYDKYHKQNIVIEPSDDELWDEISSSSSGVEKRVVLIFSGIEGDKDGCDVKRWSDLTNFEIIE
jgi:hypothetical protein